MEPRIFDTPGPLSLALRIPVGTIEVHATDTREALVELTGERDADDVVVELTPRPTGGHRLLVAYKYRKSFGWMVGKEDLRVRVEVPVGTEIDGETGSADLTVGGDVGPLSFRSGSGDLNFGNVRGNAVIKIAKHSGPF